MPSHIVECNGVKKRLRFNAKWFRQYPWLHYDAEVKGVICLHCARMSQRPAAENFYRKAAPTFLHAGISKWRDAAKYFKRHARSSCHQVAVLEAVSAGNIAQKLCTANQMEQRKARSCLKTIVTTLQFLARQELSVRGSGSDKNSNLLQALKMRSADLPELDKWMKGRFKWTSPDIQNELIKLLAREVSLKIADSVAGRPFAIICDGTTGVSGKEQESLCVRFVDKAGEIQEHFLCVIEPPDTTGKTLAAMIEGALQGYGISLSDARGQGYDGAANMAGRYNGTQALIKQTQPLALYVHCFAHCEPGNKGDVNGIGHREERSGRVQRNRCPLRPKPQLQAEVHRAHHNHRTDCTETAVSHAVDCAGKIGVRAAGPARGRHQNSGGRQEDTGRFYGNSVEFWDHDVWARGRTESLEHDGEVQSALPEKRCDRLACAHSHQNRDLRPGV